VPLHKGYTAFDSAPTSPPATPSTALASPPAVPARPALGVNKLVPVPPIQEAPLAPAPPARAQPRYEPPMPLTIAAAAPPPAPPAPRVRSSESPVFTVHGVDRSDVLYVRSAPGAASPVVGEIAPDTSGIVGMAGRQKIGPSTWREVRYGNVRGWVNARFLVEQRDANSSTRR
jgi:hypothetical protein